MSYTRTRTHPGAMYGLALGTIMHKTPEFADGNAYLKLSGTEVVLVVATQDHGTGFSLCLSCPQLRVRAAAPLLGWVHNDDLRWLDDPELYR